MLPFCCSFRWAAIPRSVRRLGLLLLALLPLACTLPFQPAPIPAATVLPSPTHIPSITHTPITPPPPTPTASATPTRLPSLTLTPTIQKTVYAPNPKGAVNSIQYAQPQKYTQPGKQSALTDAQFAEIDQKLGIKSKELADIQKVFTWKNTFSTVSAGGKWVGKNTAAQILQTRQLTGCHDHAILMAAVLRRYGFPVVQVDAAGIRWALNYSSSTKSYSGHVFIEVYLNNRWILIDATSGAYSLDYDPNQRVLPFPNSAEPQGYYSMLKGLDPDDYGVNQIEQLNQMMVQYAMYIQSIRSDLTPPPYKLQQLK